MVNMRVIKAKTAIMTVVIIAFLIIGIIKIVIYYKDKVQEVSLTSCIEETILSARGNKIKEASSMDRDNTERILSSELEMSKYIVEEKTEVAEKTQEQSNTEEKEEIKHAETGLKTEVVDNSNINNKYTNEYNGVKIKNESKYKLTEEDLKPDIDFKNKEDIVIYHTHTCESYTKTEKYTYKSSGNFRTTDLNYSVARVGEELKKYLDKYGFNVIHNKTYHDYPKYNGSYTRSLETIEKILKTSKASLVIDLHRDALGSNSKYAPSVKINGEEAAQLMFVIGTDGGGLKHDKWKKNLKLAIKIQEKANEMYPGLFKPIIVRNSRYNQHVSEGACIIEVGATGNTLEQCLVSMKYLSSVIFEVMKEE